MTEQASPEAMEKIGRIWAETLGVEAVNPSDNFFSLGGDSILVTIMVMQVEHAINRTVSADLVFDAPTLEEFTQAVAAR
jgi:acyl carrier protein